MKLVAPNLRKKIEDFENDQELASFREQVKQAAEKGEGIEMLSVMGNSYGSGFFKELSPYLEKIPFINRVILNDIFTQRREDLLISISILSEVLTGKHIKVLDISNNAVTPKGCEILFEFLKSCKHLEYFYANNCGLAQNGVTWIAKALEEGELPVKVVSMTRNRIEVKAVEVANAIKKCKNLEELVMFQNGIKEEGMNALLDACKETKKLRKLDVNDNWVMKGSVDKLCELIVTSNNLVELNVSDCNLKPEGNLKVMEAIKSSDRKWISFCYDYNELEEDKVAQEFVGNIIEAGTIQFLSLKGNEMSKETQTFILDKANKIDPKPTILFESEDEDMSDEEDAEFKALIQKFEKLSLNN